MDLMSNPLRAAGDGGLGFCYGSDPDLFRGCGALEDGPLLIALDSNIIFDLEDHGAAILDGEEIIGVDAKLQAQLGALGQILELWLLRDIRFIVVPRTRLDYRKEPSVERVASRERTFRRIEAAVTFQADDWGDEHRRFLGERPATAAVEEAIARVSILDGLMLRSAWDAGVDVFLTRDDTVLAAVADSPPSFPLVLDPAGLMGHLSSMGSNAFDLGTVEHAGCRWAVGVPFGDSGKWVPLFEALSV
ncbi:hypothetical protein [Microbacterium maritypicum]